ncbi:tripartite tricarboxylate transporter permease [Chloroflexota bacterium]
MLEAVLSASSRLLDLDVILVLGLGVVIGMIFGALPGLSGITALAIVMPLTFGWDPTKAMYFFIGIMGSVTFAGSIPAILLNTPGTAPNLCTCFDGHPMARNGQAGKALAISATSSGLGALVGVGILVATIPAMRAIVLAFSYPEFFWLVMFGLACVALAAKGNMIKGLLAGGLGISLSLVGYNAAVNATRFAGKSWYLYDGIPLVPFLIGLFAVSELIRFTIRGGAISSEKVSGKMTGLMDGVKEVFRHKITFLRSSLIGTAIGIIPGVGGTQASFIAYTTAMQASKHPETFGTGDPEGVIASEAANDAKDGGALLPTLAFGIPGSPLMAMLMGAFILHGIVPGPLLTRQHLDIVWVLVFGLVISNVLASTLGLILSPYLAKITNIKVSYVTPIVLVLCATGAYVIRGNIWDVALMVVFGFFGYAMSKFGFPTICLAMGYLLGAIAERGFHQTLMSSWGSYTPFFIRPISFTLIILLIIVVVFPLFASYRHKKKAESQGQEAKQEIKTEKAGSLYRKGSFWFTVLLLVIGMIFVLLSFNYKPVPRLIPFLIGIPTVMLTVLVLIGERYPRLISVFNVGVTDVNKMVDRGASRISQKEEMKKVLTMLLWIGGLFILIFLAGYVIATTAFVFLFLKIHGRINWFITIAMALVMGGILYFGFETLMRINMFKGILFGAYLPPL